MELCDKYLHECIKIAPSMNDFLKYKKYKHLRHIQKNFFKKIMIKNLINYLQNI